MPADELSLPDSEAPDAVLAQRSLRGDQAAMRALVERYESLVLGLCRRMLMCQHEAEDVAQESFVRAFRSLANWDSSRPFRPWLLAIAANRCRTALAKRRATACDTHALADELPARQDGRMALGNLTEEVTLALAEVRPDLRRAFELFHYDELAYAEIAELLDVPVGTVKTWIHRARQEVAARLIRRGVVESVKSSEDDEHALHSMRTAATRVAG